MLSYSPRGASLSPGGCDPGGVSCDSAVSGGLVRGSLVLPQLRHGPGVPASQPSGTALVHRPLLVIVDGRAFLLRASGCACRLHENAALGHRRLSRCGCNLAINRRACSAYTISKRFSDRYPRGRAAHSSNDRDGALSSHAQSSCQKVHTRLVLSHVFRDGTHPTHYHGAVFLYPASDRDPLAHSFHRASHRHDTRKTPGNETVTLDRPDFLQSVSVAAAFLRQQLC